MGGKGGRNVKLPDFADFLASVDFEEAEKMSQAISFGHPDVLSFDTKDAASWGPALTSVGDNAVSRASANTIALLTLYHQWLQNHLED